MKMFTRNVLALAIVAAGCLFYSANRLSAENPRAGDYRVSGPYTHDNLSVFLIHGAGKPMKKLLTLQEAIDQHKVVVYETRSVNALAIENVSANEDVFIESGDIVKGGAQDRTLKDDLILPSKSGKVSINSFCVEHGRWTRRGAEPVATFGGASERVATKELKMAVRMKANQSEVWSKVEEAQDKLVTNAGASARSAASPTSFAMTMQAPAVRKSIDGYLRELSGSIDGKNDVIGYAFAINGKVNSADVYASHELFARLWPKLLKASAVEAVSEYQSGKKFDPASPSSVKATLQDADSGKAEAKDLTERTEVVTKETSKNVMFETRDKGQHDAWVHRNYITK